MSEHKISGLEIGQATESDIDEVRSILLEAEAWLTERGMSLWSEGMLAYGAIASGIRRGEVYLARIEGAGVGTFMLLGDDSDFWPDVPQGESAVLHRLAVRRSTAGTGLAAEMIHWACDMARGDGKKYFRLDCMADRPKLRAIYENLGFQFYSDWPIYGFVVARYQLELGRL